MASFTLSASQEEPVIYLTFTSEFLMQRDLPQVDAALASCLAEGKGPVFIIVDIGMLSATFTDLTEGLAHSAGYPGALLRHPRVYEVVVITTSPVYAMVANALRLIRYGAIRSSIHPSSQAALAHVRREIDAGMPGYRF